MKNALTVELNKDLTSHMSQYSSFEQEKNPLIVLYPFLANVGIVSEGQSLR